MPFVSKEASTSSLLTTRVLQFAFLKAAGRLAYHLLIGSNEARLLERFRLPIGMEFNKHCALGPVYSERQSRSDSARAVLFTGTRDTG